MAEGAISQPSHAGPHRISERDSRGRMAGVRAVAHLSVHIGAVRSISLMEPVCLLWFSVPCECSVGNAEPVSLVVLRGASEMGYGAGGRLEIVGSGFRHFLPGAQTEHDTTVIFSCRCCLDAVGI